MPFLHLLLLLLLLPRHLVVHRLAVEEGWAASLLSSLDGAAVAVARGVQGPAATSRLAGLLASTADLLGAMARCCTRSSTCTCICTCTSTCTWPGARAASGAVLPTTRPSRPPWPWWAAGSSLGASWSSRPPGQVGALPSPLAPPHPSPPPGWLEEPRLLVRAARHYEGLVQALVRQTVLSARDQVVPDFPYP